MKYKTKWEPNNLNKEFWEEVLVGNTITKINFTNTRLSSLVLNTGEELYISEAGCGLYIKDEVESIAS